MVSALNQKEQILKLHSPHWKLYLSAMILHNCKYFSYEIDLEGKSCSSNIVTFLEIILVMKLTGSLRQTLSF